MQVQVLSGKYKYKYKYFYVVQVQVLFTWKVQKVQVLCTCVLALFRWNGSCCSPSSPSFDSSDIDEPESVVATKSHSIHAVHRTGWEEHFHFWSDRTDQIIRSVELECTIETPWNWRMRLSLIKMVCSGKRVESLLRSALQWEAHLVNFSTGSAFTQEKKMSNSRHL